MRACFKKLSEVEWEDHFMTENGRIKWIYTRERDDSPITVMKKKLVKGLNALSMKVCVPVKSYG